MAKKNNVLVLPVALVLLVVFIAGISLRPNNSHRIVINKFDSKNSVNAVEYGSRDFNLAVTSAEKSESPSGRSLKLTLKLIPGSYNFLACGQGLIDKKRDWEKRPANLNWNDIIGISYKVYIEPVKGAPEKVNMVNIATDVTDGDGEILRVVKAVHTGEWIEEQVYFKELTTRYDYQRDWKSVRWNGTGKDKTSLSQVDNGVKSYQFEIMGIVSDKPVDLAANQVEVVLYIDEVALIRR
jgi:hypothetical protein